jgi:hypothetical protein
VIRSAPGISPEFGHNPQFGHNKGAMTETEPTTPAQRSPKAVAWLAAYVYGTIATLVAIGGLAFEKHLNAVSATGVIVVGAIAIWLAHAVSNLVAQGPRDGADVRPSDVMAQLRSSWPIVSAALPAAVVMIIAAFGVWTASTGLVIDEVIGVVALAAVGIATAGGAQRSPARRVVYVASLTAVGLAIVGLEVAAHFL